MKLKVFIASNWEHGIRERMSFFRPAMMTISLFLILSLPFDSITLGEFFLGAFLAFLALPFALFVTCILGYIEVDDKAKQEIMLREREPHSVGEHVYADLLVANR